MRGFLVPSWFRHGKKPLLIEWNEALQWWVQLSHARKELWLARVQTLHKAVAQF
jgi:hypothetical protein